MAPTVIIPTFWTRRTTRGRGRSRFHYDHPTALGEKGTLPACLRSLEGVRGLGKVIILVVGTDETVEQPAEDQVREILAEHPRIDAFVVGAAELGSLRRRLEQLEFSDMIGGTMLGGYGAVRNAGLMLGAVLGSEVVVFLDDDQLVIDSEYLVRAMDGIGEQTPSRHPLLAKSGYYVDESGMPAKRPLTKWHDVAWRQNEYFNEALSMVTRQPRIKPSPMAFGGCLALHRDMYCSVPFDPWAIRGEDMDYVINARMHGGDVFMDSDWSLVHRPPKPSSAAAIFKDDVFRFVYTHRKLEFSKSQVDLRQVRAEDLLPYPGKFCDSSIVWRARVTAFLRAFTSPERPAYFAIARQAVSEAERYALENCERYFSFQRRWPMLMDRLWQDVALKSLFSGERRVDRGALTGRLPIIRID